VDPVVGIFVVTSVGVGDVFDDGLLLFMLVFLLLL